MDFGVEALLLFKKQKKEYGEICLIRAYTLLKEKKNTAF